MNAIAGAGMLMLLSLVAGGCVSSTLDAGDLRAQSGTATTDVTLDESGMRTSAMIGSEETAIGEPHALLPAGQGATVPAMSPASVSAPGQSGVDIIREKASRPAGGPTAIGITPQGATRQLNSADIRSKAAEMERTAAAVDSQITDAELAAKQAAMNEMRRKATTHYESTLNQIE